jgi:hypothetical protein
MRTTLGVMNNYGNHSALGWGKYFEIDGDRRIAVGFGKVAKRALQLVRVGYTEDGAIVSHAHEEHTRTVWRKAVGEGYEGFPERGGAGALRLALGELVFEV